MGRFLFALLLTINCGILVSQTKYPKDYFSNPLDIPLILSGSFGELRSNHFHSGLDIKTQKREGLNILSSAQGYVSRIKISHWGFGKALYVTHPNGYTTVYAHLKKFSPKIESYIKKAQYKKQRFTIELFPKPHELIIDKSEIIAFSGNTGGSGGPHLHYEIRDAASKPINPMLFGIEIPDTKRPEIRAGVIYSLGDSSNVNQSSKRMEVRFSKNEKGILMANPVEAIGVLGFGVNVIDKQDGALNNNGIYSLEMTVNGKKVYEHQVDTYAFSETRYLNAFIDYERYHYRRQRIQKCFVEPNNKLSIYRNIMNNGYVKIEDGLSYKIQITACDLKGNKSTLVIPITGKKQATIHKYKTTKTGHQFKAREFNKINKGPVTAAFPKNSFYQDFYFKFDYKDSIVQLHNESVPVHKNFTLTFDIRNHPNKNKDKLFIGRKNSKGRLYYASTRRKDGKLFTLSKTLGKYTVSIDTIKPKLRSANFKPNQQLSKYRYLKLKVSDNLTGIKNYRGEIDGRWILLEYQPKKGLLVYDFNDRVLTGDKHELKVTVSDQVNNTNTYIATFYRKE